MLEIGQELRLELELMYVRAGAIGEENGRVVMK